MIAPRESRPCTLPPLPMPALTPSVPRAPSDLPTPRRVPLLGQMPFFKPLAAHLHFEQWAREVGTPYRVSLGPGFDFVIWDDYRLLQQLSRERPDGYRRGASLRPTFQEINLDGLFSVEGAAWHPQRRLIMQALNATHFKGWFPTMAAITTRLHRRWAAAAARGDVLEMNDELKLYTVDVTSALAFGEDPNTLEKDGDRIQQALGVIFPMLMKRSFTPFRYWNLGIRLPADRRFERALDEVRAYAAERIRIGRARIAADGTDNPRNALEALLIHQHEQGLSDDDVIANVITLLVAGEDTTSHSLAWTMLYLAADPALQDRMHDEARRLLGDALVCPTHDVLHALDAFEPLALEALRLRPVVPFNSFTANEPVTLHGIAFPAGSKFIFIKRPAMLDAANFAEPQRYRPERWRQDRSAVAAATSAHEPRAFVQFGAGPRVCPGRHLATLEMRLVLSMLLKAFRIELACDPATIREVSAFTMHPSTMPVRLIPR